MACDARTLEALLVLQRENALSERDLLMCQASVLAGAASIATATDALRIATSMGLDKVSERDLEEVFLTVMSGAAGVV